MNEINLLPQVTAEEKERQQKVRRANRTSIVMLVIFLIVMLVTFGYWALLENELNAIDQTFAENEQRLASYVDREVLYRGSVYKVKQARKAFKEISTVSTLFSDALNITEGSVTISELRIDADSVRITGTATTATGLNSFLDQIERLGEIGGAQVDQVVVESIRKTTESNTYEFSLVIDIISK